MCASQVSLAQEALPKLQEQASTAAAQLSAAQAQGKQHHKHFQQQAAAVVEAAQALLQPAKTCQTAALAAQPLIEQMQTALHDMMPDLQVS